MYFGILMFKSFDKPIFRSFDLAKRKKNVDVCVCVCGCVCAIFIVVFINSKNQSVGRVVLPLWALEDNLLHASSSFWWLAL